MDSSAKTFGLAVLFEAGLGFAGVAIAWLADLPVSAMLDVTPTALERGLIATLPMILMLILLTVSRWSPLVEFRRQVEAIVRLLFARNSWLELALVSLAAGLGEELLFRGALQPLLAIWIHPLAAVAVVSLLFGLAHALSPIYFLAATGVGLYLGWLAMAYSDLVAPIVAHGLYDFIALTYVQQRAKRG
ncbi:MAG: CPBP family intramembrane metalloprotease [Planctomycetales bacterium]|nr:CPBP family intramembrane metalloprotease [Planctomycetales bacterium]